MIERKLSCVLAVSLVLLSPLTVLAETPSAKRAPSEKSANEADYAYKFDDDALLGQSAAATGTVMRVRSGATRVMLLRPRLHFVAELLKSAENL